MPQFAPLLTTIRCFLLLLFCLTCVPRASLAADDAAPKEAAQRHLQALKDSKSLIITFHYEGADAAFADGLCLTYHADYPVYELTAQARDRALGVLQRHGVLNQPRPSAATRPGRPKPYCVITAMGDKTGVFESLLPSDHDALALARELQQAVGDQKAGHSDAPAATRHFVEHLTERLGLHDSK